MAEAGTINTVRRPLRLDGLRAFVLVHQPLLGGALLLVAQVADMALRLMRRPYLKALGSPLRVWGWVLTGISALVALGLILIYPLSVDLPYLWVLFFVVLLVKARSMAAVRLNQALLSRGAKPVQRAVRLAEAVLLFAAGLALLLFLSQPTDTAWYLLGGFLLTSALEGIALYAAPARLLPFPTYDAGLDGSRFTNISAYR